MTKSVYRRLPGVLVFVALCFSVTFALARRFQETGGDLGTAGAHSTVKGKKTKKTKKADDAVPSGETPGKDIGTKGGTGDTGTANGKKRPLKGSKGKSVEKKPAPDKGAAPQGAKGAGNAAPPPPGAKGEAGSDAGTVGMYKGNKSEHQSAAKPAADVAAVKGTEKKERQGQVKADSMKEKPE